MGRIPEEIVEEVLSRTDMLQVMQQYVALKRTGANFKGLCPFHNEKTPSFYVHPGKGIYKCFGCGAGGNIYQFVMELEGWSFPEAVRQLAGRVGVEIPEASDEDAAAAKKRAEARQLYTGMMEKARRFYERALWDKQSAESERARKYLRDRGVSEEVARDFGLGYAPPGWQNLLDYMQREEGINNVLVERAGMALTRQGGSGHYDRFRDRVMFPVIDIWGNTLAFGGRVLPGDDGPKYINSSETKFYVKGRHLFGLHAAKRAIQQDGWALLVEGNFDVISLHAAGFAQAVAPMGTAFTDRQARLLKRYASKVYIAFDGDSAGASATMRCIEALEIADLEGWVIRFKPGEDPDTFVREAGAEALKKKIEEEAEPLIGWALDHVLPTGEENLSIEERVKLLEKAAEIMKYVRNPVVWRHYAEDIASRRLDIDPRLVKRYLKKPDEMRPEVEKALTPSQEERASRGSIELDKTEFSLLSIMLSHPGWLDGFLSEQLENLLRSAELAQLLHRIQAHVRSHQGELKPAALLSSLEHPGVQSLVAEALAASAGDRLYDGVAFDKLEDLEEKAASLYQDILRSLKYDWATRSLEVIKKQLTELDMSTQREAWIEVFEQQRQLEQFRKEHAANAGSKVAR